MTKFRGIKSVFLVAITTFSISAFVSQSDATAKESATVPEAKRRTGSVSIGVHLG